MGPHYENFRDAVEALRRADALRIVERPRIGEAIAALLADGNAARTMGEHGQEVFEQQGGATRRAVAALLEILEGDA
jgi:3-deoxy-D-manno-octulosonic-acid transferase